MTRSTLSRRLVRSTAALLAVAGLLTGIGVQHAAAAPAAPGTPILRSVEAISATSIVVQWEDTATTEDGFRISFYVNGVYTGRIIKYTPVAGRGGIGTFEVYALTPNTRYCMSVRSYIGTGEGGSTFSADSAQLCATTWALPDVSVTRISGQTQLHTGESSVYDVVVANLGGATSKGLFLNLRADEDLELVGMQTVPAGFDCTTTTTKYEDRPFLRCTGSLAGTESHPSNRVAVFQVRVRGIRPGEGDLNAYAAAIDDTDGSNAERTLTITVT